jgi:hypothetical protein
MASIEELIRESFNPFSDVAAKNPWSEKASNPTVRSIHEPEFNLISQTLDLVSTQSQSQTILLLGDSGSGKTHFINRVKNELRDRAIFAYVEPFPDSNSIWRHILRYTVDSLLQNNQNGSKSQLILWLETCLDRIQNNLTEQQKTLIDWLKNAFIKSDRSKNRSAFINILRQSFSHDIYNANEFFGVLYALLDPELRFLASDWLKGDSLDDESMELLKVRTLIDDETKAQGILKNFSKICGKTIPLIICFDQLENIANSSKGRIDLQSLFNVNSTIKNGGWPGFLIVISLIDSIWRDNLKYIDKQDLVAGRVDRQVQLNRISLEVGEHLYQSRLIDLCERANPQPEKPFILISKEDLCKEFPGGYTTPRSILDLARTKFDKYKEDICGTQPPISEIKEFQLLWSRNLKETQEKISKLKHYSTPESIKMLQEALVALSVNSVIPKLLSGKYAAQSLSYQCPKESEKVGVVWNEDKNMNAFCAVMRDCQNLVNQSSCKRLYLIRSETLGKEGNKGYKISQEIFKKPNNKIIIPDLESIQILATYHQLVNDVASGELILGGKTVTAKQLQELTQETNILDKCKLLKKILDGELGEKVKEYIEGIVKTQKQLPKETLIAKTIANFNITPQDVSLAIEELLKAKIIEIANNGTLVIWIPPIIQECKEYIKNLVATQKLLGKEILIQKTMADFKSDRITVQDVNLAILELQQEKFINVFNNNLVNWIPQVKKS